LVLEALASLGLVAATSAAIAYSLLLPLAGEALVELDSRLPQPEALVVLAVVVVAIP
jgi:hypothetical protein